MGEDAPPLLPDSLEPVFSQRYTNLRQALDFLSQRDNMAETAAVVGPPTPEQQQRAELSPLNRQFVDVLTYHEQRQAHLRRALLEES
jgi:transposase